MIRTHHQVPSEPERHVVQCYGEDSRELIANVARFLGAGHRRGDGLVVIGTPTHNEAILAQLGCGGVEVTAALQGGRLVVRDAQATLDRLLIDGQPDRDRFDLVVGGIIREMRAHRPGADIRAYGEMVGVLWKAWHFGAAIRLEEYWNRLLTDSRVSLFCAYPIDIFGLEFDPEMVHEVLCAHNRLLPTTGGLDQAIERAMDDVLGPDAEQHRVRIAQDPRWRSVPRGEATVLWLRANLPEQAHAILDRARHYCKGTAAA